MKALAVIGLALLSIPPLLATSPVSSSSSRSLQLSIVPHVCQAPCDVRLVATIDPHPNNRWWVLEADGPMFQGTQIMLDGLSSPRTQPAIWFKGLSAGEYLIVAVLYRSPGNEVARVYEQLMVTGHD